MTKNRTGYSVIDEILESIAPPEQRAADYCSECLGTSHVPWCSEYEEPSSEQPASATGSEWRTVCMTDTSFDLRPCWTIEQDGQPLLATAYSEKVAHQIVNDHNQHQRCAAQLQFLGNRAEELSSLLAGMTTERDDTAALAAKAGAMVTKLSEQNERLREALRQTREYVAEATWQPTGGRAKAAEGLVKQIDSALNHAKQGEGS